jgi:hypothetical protein
MDYAQDGDLTKFDAYDIADAAGWEGDAQAFLDALIACGIGEGAGFVERDEYGTTWLHDWQDYGGKLFAERKKNAEKQSRYRESKATPPSETIPQESRNRNVTVTSPVTLKERRGEKSISSPPTPTEPQTPKETTEKAFSLQDPLPLHVQNFLTESCPDFYEAHLRLALVGRSPNGLASYALEILRGWKRGINAPQAPLPDVPLHAAPPETPLPPGARILSLAEVRAKRIAQEATHAALGGSHATQ